MLLSQQAQTTLFGEAVKSHKLPKTQYLGSKERLVKWIFDNAPKEIESFLDAFSGTSVVGYYFKNKGKRVIVNDFLNVAVQILEGRCFLNIFTKRNHQRSYWINS